MNTLELIELGKAKEQSYRQLAIKIGVRPQLLTDVRAGRKNLEPYHAARIAELIGENALAATFSALAAQAKAPAEKTYWKKKLDNALRAAALVLGIFVLAAVPEPSHASAEKLSEFQALYIVCKRLMRAARGAIQRLARCCQAPTLALTTAAADAAARPVLLPRPRLAA